MEIISNRDEMIFRKDFEGKPSYSLGLSKRNQEGKFINGYIKVNFKKGTNLKNKTKIKINNGWLDFYKENDKTIPTLFINDFTITDEGEIQETKNDEVNAFQYMKAKVESDIGQQIEITDDEIPF